MRTVKGILITIRDLVEQIEEFFSVETKDSRVIPFILNNKQNELVVEIIKAKKPLRIIILKGRQFGFSTFILAFFFVKCLLVKNTRAAVISHTEQATKKLFRKVKFFSNTLVAKPTLDKESEKEFTFPKTNSSFYIGTAGTKSFGRGDNITDLHCSEVSFWDNAGTIMNGLLQAVGMTGNVYIETTANGYGNYFQKLWGKSWKNSKSTWTALFFSWTNFEEYEMDEGEDFIRTTEEDEIVEKYLSNFTEKKANRKLKWRRWKIDETETERGFTPEEIFRQEYPFTCEEAFLSSGTTFFDNDRIIDLISKAKDPIETGEMDLDENKNWKFNPGSKGSLKIWELPEEYGSYVIGGDVAEGKIGGDYSVLNVINNKTLKTVAKYKARIRPDELAKISYALGMWYNKAYLAIESNTGLWVLTELLEKYSYPNLYFRERIDDITHAVGKQLGFHTGDKTRKPLLDNLLAEVNKYDDIWNNADFLRECLVFIRNDRGRPEAMSGEHDDEIIATAIAYYIRENAPSEKPKPREPIEDITEKLKAKFAKMKQDNSTISQKDYI